MPSIKTIFTAILLVLAVAAIAGCTGTSNTTPTAENSVSANYTTPPGGAMPSGMPPSGNATGGQNSPPGSSSSSSTYTLSGVYTVDGKTVTETGATYTSHSTNVSAVYVTNGGNLTLVNPTIVTSGDTTSQDDSSFYGLNAGVLATSGSTIAISGGSVTTSGTGANGVFATGTDASITLSDVTIKATNDGGHGVDATLGGSLTLTNVDITTSGSHGAALATDRGSGTITATGGTVTTSGVDSPGIYSTGVITVTGGKITATGSEAVVVEGANSVAVTDTALTGAKGTRDRAVMLYQSFSGDAENGTASFAMTGGSLTWPSTTGPVFYVTNTNAVIKLTGVTIVSSSPKLLNASANSWGTSGSNGGQVTFAADDETLAGSIVADSISSIAAMLQNDTTLTGSISSAALILDSSSTWNVTADSTLTSLNDEDSTLANINDNGHTIYYDSGLSANSWIGGKTVTLKDGGKLTPK